VTAAWARRLSSITRVPSSSAARIAADAVAAGRDMGATGFPFRLYVVAARHQKDAPAAGLPGQRRLALRAISLPASLLAPLNSEAVALGADRA
jgi:hypothetical protein